MDLISKINELEAKQQELLTLSKELEKWNHVATTYAYNARVKILDQMKTIIKDTELINKDIESY